MSFANLFKGLTTAAEDNTAAHGSGHPQRKGSKHVPSSQEKVHDSFGHAARQQQQQHGKELKSSNEKRIRYHDERQGHKTRKSFSHKDSHMGNYKQPSLGFSQQLDHYIRCRDAGLNKTNSRPEVDCGTNQHHKYDNPQQQQQQQRNRKWTHKEESKQHRPNNRGRNFARSGQHQAHCTRRDFSARGTNRGGKKDPPVERKRYMTQEFKDQNGMEVDGQLVCRHFMCGRCVKGDECQLPHVQNMTNNMIKEACKFYIQGCCTKGENCPYMHNSFPCKHFHARGKCSQGAECRFSHEPLTDLTKKLLDGALKRDLDYAEMQMKAQLHEPGQSDNTEEPLAAENVAVNKPKLEIRLDSIRPNFYNSSCSSEAHAEKVTVCHAGVSADTEKDGVPLCDTDPGLCNSVASTQPGDGEMVPYSVEAVLGSQISKIFPSVPRASAGQESTSPSFPSTSIHCPSNSASQSAVPYSVNAVLESYKPEETSKCSPSSSSISKALYIPLSSKTVPSPREIPDPPGYSATCKEKVFYSDNSGSESNIPLERRVTGQTACQLPLKQFATTKRWSNPPHTSVGSKELVGNVSMFQKPPITKEESQVPVVQNTTSKHFIKTIARLKMDITDPQDPIESLQANNPAVCSDGLTIKGVLPPEPVVAPSKNKTAFHNLFLNLPSQSSAPKCSAHSVQLKSHLPCTPADHGEPVQSTDPSLIVAHGKSALRVSATHITCQSISTNPVIQKCVLKQKEKIKGQSLDTLGQTDNTQPPDQAQAKFTDADCKITMTQDVKSTVDGITFLTKPFHRLFEIIPSVQTTPDALTTLSCPQSSSHSSYPTPNSTDCKEKVTPMRPVVESGEDTERPFLSLFVSPPCEPSAPSPPEWTKALQPINCTSGSRGCKQKASGLGVKRLFTDHATDSDTDTPAAPRSPQSPPRTISKKVKCTSATEYDLPESHACRPSPETPNETSTVPVYIHTQTDQHPPKALSHKVSPTAATKNSVLSTLFLHLSPYHEDKEPQSIIQKNLSLECENEDGSTLIGRQQEREVKGKQVDELMEKTTQDEPMRIPVESSPCLSMREPQQQCQREAAGSASKTAGVTECQVRTTGTHSLPIQPVTRPHTQLATKQSCQQRKSVDGNGDGTTFSTIKNLFQTLDPTASPFGQ